MQNDIITENDIKIYTQYNNIIENKEFLKLLISATNIMMKQIITSSNYMEYNELHKIFALNLFSYLLNYNSDNNSNIIEFIKSWVI